MSSVLSITGPIYLLIALGYLFVRGGVMAQSDMRIIGRFVVQFCLPAMLLRALMHLPIGQVLNAPFLLAYTAGSLLVLCTVLTLSRGLWRQPMSQAAMQALGASGSNSGFVGYPILLQLIGPTAGVALALVQIVENLLIIPLCLALADTDDGGPTPWHAFLTALKGLSRNPMIIAIVAGLVISALSVPIPPVVDKVVSLAAGAAPPTALFVIGGSLVGLRLGGAEHSGGSVLRDMTAVALGKLLLHPLAVLAALSAVTALGGQVPPPLFGAAVVFAAMPMLSIYPLLAQRHGLERRSAATLLLTTVLSFASVSALVAWLPTAWLAVPK